MNDTPETPTQEDLAAAIKVALYFRDNPRKAGIFSADSTVEALYGDVLMSLLLFEDAVDWLPAPRPEGLDESEQAEVVDAVYAKATRYMDESLVLHHSGAHAEAGAVCQKSLALSALVPKLSEVMK